MKESIAVFWLEPTGETRITPTGDRCDCGDPECKVGMVTARLFRRTDTGEVTTPSEAPVGAMWDAQWMHREWCTGPDGIALVVKTPGGDWMVDAECSNCTRTQWGPKEIDGIVRERVWLGRTHWCWVRHGDPRNPATLHVDKDGETCSAGAGSIQCGSYHGFLHHGHLVKA